ncbi:hypothetical protein GXM_03758 [Nostoc sphaeroides CCNUC1]|uniref:Uncharacterized protein n=1 Tax=Nostoc sphaeroides CCNUC1 TaxID=2653204 RepID=A0A5P8W0N7_9NOSO|nr:hypothetical protein GXM_03758 [Nostoc sphaeroides CCNUC1]
MSFQRTQQKLIAAVQPAKQEIAEGTAKFPNSLLPTPHSPLPIPVIDKFALL